MTKSIFLIHVCVCTYVCVSGNQTENENWIWEQWDVPVILALGSQNQEGLEIKAIIWLPMEFEASLRIQGGLTQ